MNAGKMILSEPMIQIQNRFTFSLARTVLPKCLSYIAKTHQFLFRLYICSVPYLRRDNCAIVSFSPDMIFKSLLMSTI